MSQPSELAWATASTGEPARPARASRRNSARYLLSTAETAWSLVMARAATVAARSSSRTSSTVRCRWLQNAMRTPWSRWPATMRTAERLAVGPSGRGPIGSASVSRRPVRSKHSRDSAWSSSRCEPARAMTRPSVVVTITAPSRKPTTCSQRSSSEPPARTICTRARSASSSRRRIAVWCSSIALSTSVVKVAMWSSGTSMSGRPVDSAALTRAASRLPDSPETTSPAAPAVSRAATVAASDAASPSCSARAAASASTSRWVSRAGAVVAQGGPERRRAVDADVEACGLGPDDAVRRRGETGDEPERDAGHLGLGLAGAPRGWQVTLGQGRIVGNFHHERTLPTVDSVTSAVRGRRSATEPVRAWTARTAAV